MHFTFVTAVAVATALAALFPGLAAATATPSLSASKTYSCTNNKTKGYNCPAKGKLINPMVIGYESNIANLNACRDICLSHDECITFKWVVSGGQCTQYSTTLPKMGLVFDNSQVGDMYNRNCFVCDNGTPMSTSSSSSAPSPVQPTTTTSAAQAPTTLVTTLVTTTVCETSSSSSPVPPVMTTTTQSSSTSIEPTTTSSNASAGTSPPPAVCANKGLAWAEYRSDAEDNTDTTYSSFDPTAFKDKTPECSGTTTNIGGVNAPSEGKGDFSVYGSSCTFYSKYFALDHVGYIYAPMTGTYNITAQDTDDAIFLWVGGRDGKTMSGWNRQNADAITNYNSNYGISLTQVTLVAGTYTPIRVMFAQGQGGAGFAFRIYDPAGNAILATGQPDSGYVVQFGCGTDAAQAPQFAAWGMES